MPVRNGREYISSAIHSVLRQTYKEFELWVLENGSDDGTAEIVRSIPDARIKLFELGPVGVQGALQYAIEHAHSQWLARTDADDLMFPNRLEWQLNFLRQNPTTVFLGTSYAYLTPFGHIIELRAAKAREVTKQEVAGRRGFPDSSLIFSRLAALRAGGVDGEFQKCDGLPLMFRLLTQGKAWAMAEHLQLYRLRPNSLSKEPAHDGESRKIHLKYAPEFFTQSHEQLQRSFWRLVARLELLTGDSKAVRNALDQMMKEGDFEAEINAFPFNNAFGNLGRTYFNLRYNRGYRHREDWERLFSSVLNHSRLSCQ